jgi:16S rRNA (guanine527-N7)-methyltransferase
VSAQQPPARFAEAAEAYGIEFDPGDLDKIGEFLSLLLEANTRFNLTAVTDPDEAWVKHVFDSLTLLPYVLSAEAGHVIDVGSGGGLPGVPLALTMPEVDFTLLEATGKKADFLRDVAERMDLANVDVISDRAETIAHDCENHREQYDLVVARAVGRLVVLAELAVPLVRVGGHVAAIKGAKAVKEIEEAAEALRLLHSEVVETTRTPTGTIVLIEKLRRTAKLYPRRPGEPKRAPLGVSRDR